MMKTQFRHETVLLDEAVEALVQIPDGLYVDGTFGRGGHSRAVLKKLSASGQLVGIDKDPQAIGAGRALMEKDSRFRICHSSFANMASHVEVGSVDGVLLDLGVSSPQLDDAERGFSFMQDGPLDMRMNPEQGFSASEWLAKADDNEIADVLKRFGEERFAKRIARAIVREREHAPITTTSRLADVVSEANPSWEKGKHPATRAFQGIRIFINSELDDLTQALDSALQLLKPGGRLVVISFHSLEDRIVKRFIRKQEKGEELPRWLPITDDQIVRTMRSIGRAIKPGDKEVNENPRARSAVMRIAEKLD